MADFLASLNYNAWILPVLLMLPTFGAVLVWAHGLVAGEGDAAALQLALQANEALKREHAEALERERQAHSSALAQRDNIHRDALTVQEQRHGEALNAAGQRHQTALAEQARTAGAAAGKRQQRESRPPVRRARRIVKHCMRRRPGRRPRGFVLRLVGKRIDGAPGQQGVRLRWRCRRTLGAGSRHAEHSIQQGWSGRHPIDNRDAASAAAGTAGGSGAFTFASTQFYTRARR